MNYQEFKNMLKDRMQKIMGDTIQVGFETYTKNNQTPIESLMFQEKDSSAATVITPAIHMQDLYNSNFPHQKWDSHIEKSIL